MFIDWDGDGEVTDDEFILSTILLLDDDDEEQTSKKPKLDPVTQGSGCMTSVITIALAILSISLLIITIL